MFHYKYKHFGMRDNLLPSFGMRPALPLWTQRPSGSFSFTVQKQRLSAVTIFCHLPETAVYR